MSNSTHDLIIIGTGPAGYTASIYARRYKIDTLLIGPLPGGQITEAHRVCNFPGYSEITGMDLGQLMHNHSKEVGAKEVMGSVVSVKRENDHFLVKTGNFGEFTAKTILLAHGTKRRKLDLPNEENYLGKGISYCATCDGTFFNNKVVGVTGGSNAATTAALLLSGLAEKVYLIYRGKKLKGDQIWVDKLYKRDNVEVVLERSITKLMGTNKLNAVGLDKKYKESKELKIDGLFVEIGSIPGINIVEKLDVITNDEGYILVEEDQSTNVEGVYAAGDITTGSNNFRQVITACSEGAIAANSIYKFLSQ